MRLDHRHYGVDREINDLLYLRNFVFGVFRGAHDESNRWDFGIELTYYPRRHRGRRRWVWLPDIRVGRLRLWASSYLYFHYAYTVQVWVAWLNQAYAGPYRLPLSARLRRLIGRRQ